MTAVVDVERIASQAVAQLRGLQHKRELAGLLQLVADVAPATIVEIGTRTGATLWALSQAAPDAMLVSIDPTNQRRFLEELIGGGRVPDRELHLITGRSQEPSTLIELERILDGRPIGFLFVDGDHTLAGVERDVAMYVPLLEPILGFVALHDIRTIRPEVSCDVHQLWARLGALPGAFEIVDEEASPAYGIGIVPASAFQRDGVELPAVMAGAHAAWARRRYPPGHPMHPDRASALNVRVARRAGRCAGDGSPG